MYSLKRFNVHSYREVVPNAASDLKNFVILKDGELVIRT